MVNKGYFYYIYEVLTSSPINDFKYGLIRESLQFFLVLFLFFYYSKSYYSNFFRFLILLLQQFRTFLAESWNCEVDSARQRIPRNISELNLVPIFLPIAIIISVFGINGGV